MSYESRKLPNSNIARTKALNAAKKKNDSIVGTSPLSTGTIARLNLIQPKYLAQNKVIAKAKTAMVKATGLNDGYKDKCETGTSQFIQVFNFAIIRDTFVKEDRAYYKLDVATGNVPPMTNAAEILEIAFNIVDGETTRIAGGGAPMAMPALAEILNNYTNFNVQSAVQNTAVEVYNQSLRDLDALNAEADAVIKKVWDEMETFYNEQPAPAMRASCRLWGVIYILSGSNKIVSGLVLDGESKEPIPDAVVFLENGSNKDSSGADGAFSLNTTLMNTQNLMATHDLYDDFTVEIVLVENENLVVNILMTKSV